MDTIEKECENCRVRIIKTKGDEYWQKNKVKVEIDLDSTNYTCGVSGIINASNVRIQNCRVFCANCGAILYNEDDRPQIRGD